VQSFYPPGAEVVIFSDGRVFSGKLSFINLKHIDDMISKAVPLNFYKLGFVDLLALSGEAVGAYQQECKRISTDAGYSHIRFDNLENHLAKESSAGTGIDQVMLIDKLLEASGVTGLEAQLEEDPNLSKLHESIKCFLRLDLEPSKDSLLSEFTGASQKRLKEAFKQKCGEVAKSMILRNMVCKFTSNLFKIFNL
jgi:pyoverdine/dityrosine biosynthesis protein Dit1